MMKTIKECDEENNHKSKVKNGRQGPAHDLKGP